MDIFDILNIIGGLCLFLFGMNVMGDGLERRAGNSLFNEKFEAYAKKYSISH